MPHLFVSSLSPHPPAGWVQSPVLPNASSSSKSVLSPQLSQALLIWEHLIIGVLSVIISDLYFTIKLARESILFSWRDINKFWDVHWLIPVSSLVTLSSQKRAKWRSGYWEIFPDGTKPLGYGHKPVTTCDCKYSPITRLAVDKLWGVWHKVKRKTVLLQNKSFSFWNTLVLSKKNKKRQATTSSNQLESTFYLSDRRLSEGCRLVSRSVWLSVINRNRELYPQEYIRCTCDMFQSWLHPLKMHACISSTCFTARFRSSSALLVP